MRRALLLSSVLVLGLLAPGCSDDPGAQPIGDPVDTGVGADTAVADSGGRVDSTAGDSAEADSTMPDSGSTDGAADDAGGDATTGDTGTGDTGTGDTGTGDTTIADTASPEVGVDSAVDTYDAGPDTGPFADASPAIVPVGKTCSTNADCDPTGAGVGQCSSKWYPLGSLDPTPVCLSNGCDLGTASIGKPCGLAGEGLCIGGGAGGTCFDGCTYTNSSTVAATGCPGKNACNPFVATRDGMGAVIGRGYCQGGCRVDADCTLGDKCQTEEGLCMKTLTVYAKKPGDACTNTTECLCNRNTSTGKGFCTKNCTSGDATTCPAGFVCDPGLPTADATGPLFSATPPGLVGSCFKQCTSDADCTLYDAWCAPSTATALGIRTCHPGPKPI